MVDLAADAGRARQHRADQRRRDRHDGAEGLPNTFVPGRNLLFLTYAAAIA